jgi:membrane protein implicated in regulation of membrane protease activity
MEIPGITFWWVAAGVAVIAELGTGTFYLLMIALGMVAAALAAHAGLAPNAQIAVAALVGAGATVGWHWFRSRHALKTPVSENRDINLDVGERIHVDAWAEDRTTRVQYRGSSWTARLAADAPAIGGEHVVEGVEGNWLILGPRTLR